MSGPSAFAAITEGAARCADLRPWPRFAVDDQSWTRAAAGLRDGVYSLSGYWGEPGRVNLALIDPGEGEVCVLSLDRPAGHFPSVAAVFLPAGRLERTIRDLHGLQATGTPDPRPWLDHGRWPASPAARASDADPGAPYPFLPADGESLHQIPVGPVHGLAWQRMQSSRVT